MLRIVIAACERAKKRRTTDPWLRPTLLVAAFDAGDADKAEELADEVAAEGPAIWQIDSILSDLDTSLPYVHDEQTSERLRAVIGLLKA